MIIETTYSDLIHGVCERCVDEQAGGCLRCGENLCHRYDPTGAARGSGSEVDR